MGKKLQFTELDQYLFGQGTNCLLYTSPSPRDP